MVGQQQKSFAQESGIKLELEESLFDPLTPPAYSIEGIDLVTEGAVTLNQLYNIWGFDRNKMNKKNPVTELYDFILSADRINLFVGGAINMATNDISYKQMHILPRYKIIPLLTEKIQEMGKLVVTEHV